MEDKKKYIQDRLKNNHFIQHMGILLHDLQQGEATLRLTIEKHHLQQNGFTHGGVTATLCDVATGIAAYTAVAEGKNVVTVDLKVSYLNPSISNNVKAVGRVVKSGNFLVFCEGMVYDIFDDGTEKPVATCTSIMAAVDIPVQKSML